MVQGHVGVTRGQRSLMSFACCNMLNDVREDGANSCSFFSNSINVNIVLTLVSSELSTCERQRF